MGSVIKVNVTKILQQKIDFENLTIVPNPHILFFKVFVFNVSNIKIK